MFQYAGNRYTIGVLITIVLFSSIATPGAAGPEQAITMQSRYEEDLATITGGPGYEHASIGIIVVDPATGRTLYEKNADEMFAPASTTKIFSSAAVLEALGYDYRFKTPVYATGTTDRNGNMDGNLILLATGDLSMGGRTLQNDTIEFTDMDHGDANALEQATLTTADPLAGLRDLASQVKAAGITKVSDVIIDDRLFNLTDLGKEFILSPVMINDNLIDITITPKNPGAPADLAMRPQTSLYRLENRVTTGKAGEYSALSVTGEPGEVIVVSGTIAADAGPVNRTVSVENPSRFARTLFVEALEREGVLVDAPAAGENQVSLLPAAGDYDRFKKVAELTSPPLIEDVKLTLKVSQNMHADTYIMLISKASNTTGFYEGMLREGEILRSLGLDTSGVSLGDGEGGVKEDQISPRSVAQLLTIISTRPYAEMFVQALPVLGVDGSLSTACDAKNPACGRVYAKTGTTGSYNPINNQGLLLSKGLAGYVDAESGKRLVFAIYANNVPYTDIEEMMAVGNDLGSIAGMIYTNF